jgi:serine/threonine-protein kinase
VEEATKKPIRPGDVLEGKWRIEGKIGQGGMGSVFVATDIALERKVAIKALASELCGDEEFVARFEREAKATANLEHPNVILVYGVGRHQGRPFLVMKWLQGESLARRLAQAKTAGKTIPPGETLNIVRQICSGLVYIHSAGLVHRDIKAGNIFLSPDGRATILDFGILRNLKVDDGLTRAGVVMGTPFYVSPEQATNKGLDHRSDLYALGVMLYEMLTGAPPYVGENEFDVVSQHVHAPPPDPRIANPSLPKEAALVMQRAIAKDPNKRYQSGTELSDALELAFANDPTVALADGTPTSRTGFQSTTAKLASARAQGSKMLWIGIGLGAAMVVVGVVLVVSMADSPPPTPPPVVVVKPPKPPKSADNPPTNPRPGPKPAVPNTAVAPDDEEYDDAETDAERAAAADLAEPDAGAMANDDLLKDAVRHNPHHVDSMLRRKDSRAPPKER